jgi:uncharacterized membrane protein YfcA
MLGVIAGTSFALSFYGASIGLILGHLRLPLLIYYLPSTAAGMATNLAISGTGALTGAYRHAMSGRVSLRLIALMGLPSMVGAYLGAVFLLKVDPLLARMIIGSFLITGGLFMLFGRSASAQGETRMSRMRMVSEVVVGLAIGFLASLTGLMLGSLRLPMMIRVLRIDAGVAVGTNMVIGCLTAFSGAVSLWPRGESLPVLPLLVIVPPTILGGYLGACLTGRFRKEVLQRLVGCTIALLGLAMTAEGTWRYFTS